MDLKVVGMVEWWCWAKDKEEGGKEEGGGAGGHGVCLLCAQLCARVVPRPTPHAPPAHQIIQFMSCP